MSALVLGTVLPWLLIAVGSWLGYQLVRQNGRILLAARGDREATQAACRGKVARSRAGFRRRGGTGI